MKRSARQWIAALVLLAAGGLQGATYDLIVRGGRVIDGTGSPAVFADVGVKDGRVVAIGRVAGDTVGIIDAQGLVVAPGFIDVHTHAEEVFRLPLAENFVRMGVTTLVTGNCGSSTTDIASFLAQLETNRASVNVATLIGHGSVREVAMGGSFNRAPSEEETGRMRALVRQGMAAGALGLSTGLIYVPGSFAQAGEIIDLARIAADADGIYATHMRDEGVGILAALEEAFTVGRQAHLRVQISHIKLTGPAAWGRAAEVLAVIDRARREGLDVTQDEYVYTAASTGIGSLVPEESRDGGNRGFNERLVQPGPKAEMMRQMRDALARSGRTNYAHAVIADYPADRSLNGLDLVSASQKRWGAATLDDQIALILEIQSNGGATGVFHGMDEDDLRVFLRHPNTMIASDSGLRRLNHGVPHPRGYGNTARVFARYVRELGDLRLEEAVRRMTALPATTFRLRKRGMILEGYAADLVIFDPARIQDRSTFTDPHHYADGIVQVVVNGELVVKNGEHTGARPGLPIRNGKDPCERPANGTPAGPGSSPAGGL